MTRLYVLFEHAAGYSLFKCLKFEDVDQFLLDIQKSTWKLNDFQSIVELVNFQPFRTGRDALENMNSISEGILHTHLQEFLDASLPTKKRTSLTLGVSESKLASAIAETLAITCSTSGAIPDVIRGIRFHFHNFVEGFNNDIVAAQKAQLGLGHHYSRARVKFNVNRIDNMIIQSINLVDQLDKDINTFTMRVREWYSHHFPELIRIVPDNATYLQCVCAIRDRKNLPEDIEDQLDNLVNDRVKAQRIVEVSKSSMGMDISPMDLENVYVFAERIMSLTKRRADIMEYLKSKMHSVAPNLAALIGDIVGARLISHAGSLINLAKYPASTVQILGAEKALFRALKTRGNTPKYGLIFHSRFIGKAAKSNKGKISRYLANKCSVASRIDCFRDNPSDVFGNKLRQQVEDRLKFFETGEIPAKNIDVMSEALDEAEVAEAEVRKRIKKEKKKKRKMEESANESAYSENDESMNIVDSGNVSMVESDGSIKKKKKKKRSRQEMDEEMSFEAEIDTSVLQDQNEVSSNSFEKKKKKKRKSHNEDEALVSPKKEVLLNSDELSFISSEKKKKKKKKSLCEE